MDLKNHSFTTFNWRFWANKSYLVQLFNIDKVFVELALDSPGLTTPMETPFSYDRS